MTTVEYTAPRSWRPALSRYVFLLDLVGLFATVVVVGLMLPDGRGQELRILAVTVGIICWMWVRPRTLLPTVSSLARSLLAPIVAALVTLVILAALRDYYSGRFLARYVVSWTSWMLVVRAVIRLLRSRPTLLLVGDSKYWSELKMVRSVRTIKLRRPPDMVSGWDGIVLDPNAVYDPEWVSWLAHAEIGGTQVISAPLLVEELTGRVPVDALEGRWAPSIFHGDSPYALIKRLVDILLTLAFSPIILVVVFAAALLVVIDDGRPAFFSQLRVGRNGTPFRIFKVRTMRRDSEAGGAVFARSADSRVTKLGSILRRFRFDELPQFWNVLVGDMSIVGPRPEQLALVRRFEVEMPLYTLRHNVRPGITGWAQVNQGYAANVDETREKLRLDLYYVKHVSALLDMRIAAMTFWTLLSGFGSR